LRKENDLFFVGLFYYLIFKNIFFLIFPDPVQLQAIKLWLLPLALPSPRLVKKNKERHSAADIQNGFIKVYEE
jgi:hypothetical protein